MKQTVRFFRVAFLSVFICVNLWQLLTKAEAARYSATRCYCACIVSQCRGLLGEATSVFSRTNERLHHLCIDEVSIKAVQLVQPKFITGVISVLTLVWIATQIPEVLHQHKRSIKFRVIKIGTFSNLS